MHQLHKRLWRRFLTYSKFYKLLWYFLPKGVYVFNYHRVGRKEDSIYDRTIFSCDAETFDQQIVTIKSHFTVISCKELSAMLDKHGPKFKERYALITFDDGYLDNYTEAFPVLKKHQVSAVFFLPVNFIGADVIPWWDQMAHTLRQHIGQNIRFPGEHGEIFLDPANPDRTIHYYIHKAKRLPDYSAADVLHFLLENYPLPAEQTPEAGSIFMDWQQAKDMLNQGMEIGSHTIHHPILSEVDETTQRLEITDSKKLLEQKLETEIIALAYPTGRKNCYNQLSVQLAQEAGYQLAFSNEPGINTSNNILLYEITRFSVSQDDIKASVLCQG
ncbi:polysaccharide deacetylase family protein [Alkalimonas collagenimarina]|uniref:Polysaccharide deacetylase family protein n=1 Tax=Alkalimonas collagenimarina TaxID=400390 RepID=A0ABT9GZJ3_9GAMM|nr:polysaccharide deacetylase family protein [Alkalimonas collagenimarina]MDP4536378.1 polysaccharide deacetylase family protein [Alkalimonas collagenimarina]